jgi:hypothetical protein
MPGRNDAGHKPLSFLASVVKGAGMVRNCSIRLVDRLHTRFTQGLGEPVGLSPQERESLQTRLTRLQELGPEFATVRLSADVSETRTDHFLRGA